MKKICEIMPKEKKAKLEMKTEKFIRISQKVSKVSIFLLIFLLPLFFLPQTTDILDFNKQALLIFLSFLAFFSWLTNQYLLNSFQLNFTILNIPVLILLLVMALATLFSLWPWGSFWGWPLESGASFLTLFCLILLYFLISTLFSKKEIILALVILILSGSLAALIGSFQLYEKFLFPWDFSQTNSFNTIGSPNSLAIFLASLFPVVFSLVYFGKKTFQRALLAIAGVLIFLGLIFINFRIAWLVFLVAILTFLIFGMMRIREIGRKWLFLLMILLAFSLLFGIFRIPISNLPSTLWKVFPTTPLEVSPNYQSTFEVSKEMIKKRPIFGFGPGTFQYGWSQFKSQTLNQTIFWNVRFTKGASEIVENLGTVGLLGIISILGLIGFFIYLSAKNLLSEISEKIDFWTLKLGIFSGFLAIFAGKLFYFSNLTLEFLFWLFLASFGAISFQKIKSFKIKAYSSLSGLISLFIVLLLAAGISLFFIEGQRWLAEAEYTKGVKEFQRGKTEESINLITKASKLNPSQDLFLRDLAQVLLLKIQNELQRTDISLQEISQRVGFLIQQTVNEAANKATEINPQNGQNWIVRAEVYRNLIGIIPDQQETINWAINCYKKAGELEPTNPFVLVGLARVYLTQVSLLSQQPAKEKEARSNLEKAKENIKKAIELKADYAPAHYQMALIYGFEGKREEAILTLEKIKQMPVTLAYNPLLDIGLAFQLGVLYYQTQQFDKAQVEFERAVLLNSNYSNARYYLGLIYDKKGQKKKAIEQFEKIEELNPENQEVKNILKNLRAGKEALEGIVTERKTVPIEEKPR
jgi:tetratricopeptide (TPR) repeat protein